MSTPAMVPVFSPDGQLGDIPVERAQEAQKAGFHVGVHVQSADGQDGIIPANRTAEAVKSGMKVVPLQDQPSQHPGFLQALGSDLKGMLAGAGQIPQMALGGTPFSMMPMAGNMAINDMQRSMEGRSMPYRAIAPVGEAVGVNVRGMEESANQGDTGGVLGHAAAVPTAMAAGEALGRAPLGRMAQAGGALIKGGAEKTPIIGPIAKGAILSAIKSWRESGATPPQVNPALVSQSRTLPGMNSPEVIRPPAQPIPQRSGLMLPGDIDKLIPASKVSTTPPTKSAQVAQAKGIPAVKDMSTVLPRLQEIAKQIQAKEAAAPANADLTPALQKSLQPRIEGKIMQVLRKEGLNSTIGMEKLMDAPELKGISREQVQAAARSLRDSGKVWGHEARGAGEEGPSIYGIALRKR